MLSPEPQYKFLLLVLQCCPEDQLLRLCHEGGLISKLRGTMSLKGGSMFNLHGPEMTIMKLTEVWTRNCYKLSNEMYKRFQGEVYAGSCCMLQWLVAACIR